MKKVVIIGAGVGGLSTAAILSRAGLDVTVLEAHVYAGGCAGTFYHQGYRFEAGATLAGGFYPGGPMDIVAQAVGIAEWPAHPSDPSMTVQLPSGEVITRWGDPALRAAEHREHFGPAGEKFFAWQERTADALWDLALRFPAWPPQTLPETIHTGLTGLQWLAADPLARLNPALAADAFRPVAAHLRNAPENLRQFVDGQLLIAAQTTSDHAYALYGASALDLPRRGVVHLQGGIGAIADTIVQAVRRQGGKVLFRKEVTRIRTENGRPVAVETKRGEVFDADIVIANLPPWNIRTLLGDAAPRNLQTLPEKPADGWGAFMVYLGVDSSVIPAGAALHHQVIAREPLAEGNTVFVSISPEWDTGRAPGGRRAITISTHTHLNQWWQLYHTDRAAYDLRKHDYLNRMITHAERALPGLRAAADLTLPGTPVTFQRFTRREWGWVGGFPQTNLFRAWGPRLAPNLWMVGDSIFPGQSTAAVALGGIRVARTLLSELGLKPAPLPKAAPPPAQPAINPQRAPSGD